MWAPTPFPRQYSILKILKRWKNPFNTLKALHELRDEKAVVKKTGGIRNCGLSATLFHFHTLLIIRTNAMCLSKSNLCNSMRNVYFHSRFTNVTYTGLIIITVSFFIPEGERARERELEPFHFSYLLMRDLDLQLVTRFCNIADLSCAQVLWIQGQDAAILDEAPKLSRIDAHNSELLPNAYLINLSR